MPDRHQNPARAAELAPGIFMCPAGRALGCAGPSAWVGHIG